MKVMALFFLIICLTSFAQAQHVESPDVEKARQAFIKSSENYIKASIKADSDLNTAKSFGLGLLDTAKNGGLMPGKIPVVIPAITNESFAKYEAERNMKAAAETLKQEIKRAEFLSQEAKVKTDLVDFAVKQAQSMNAKREDTQVEHLRDAVYVVDGVTVQVVLLPVTGIVDMGVVISTLLSEAPTLTLAVAKGLAFEAAGLGALASIIYAGEKGLGHGIIQVDPYSGKNVTKLNAPPKLGYEATVKDPKLTLAQEELLKELTYCIAVEEGEKNEKEIGGVTGLTKEELEILQKIHDANNPEAFHYKGEDVLGGGRTPFVGDSLDEIPPKNNEIRVAKFETTPATYNAAKVAIKNNNINCLLVMDKFKPLTKSENYSVIQERLLIPPSKLSDAINKMSRDAEKNSRLRGEALRAN